MKPIVTVTVNPAVDKSTSVDHVSPERKLRCTAPAREPGGGGINVARAIRKLGGEATAIWACGGLTGAMLEELLAEEGIAQEPFRIEALTRENLIVYEEQSGQQFRFGMPGAPLTAAERTALRGNLRKLDPAPEYLVLSGSLPPDVPADFYAQLANETSADTRVVLDTSTEALRRGCEASLFLIKPNIRELGQLAGREIFNDADLHRAAMQLIESGRVEAVVVSLGSGGAVLVTAETRERVAAPTVKARSKVGAGDSTVAGMVLALHRGESLHDAVRFGVACGAACVMTEGTQLCRREDAERLFHSMRE